MKYVSVLDEPEVSIVIAVIIADVGAAVPFENWLELGSRLTVSVILLIGLYFLNKMKEVSETKREQALKALIESTANANEEIKNIYEARITDLARQVLALEQERKELQEKLFKCKTIQSND